MICTNCPATTDNRGRARLRLRRLPRTETRAVTVIASVPDADPAAITIDVIGIATIPVTIQVSSRP